ncbi:DUF502 domain-containing protein [Algoriphagus halophytocola]|uniref:DUF502 domain-containing protein n=1 Tax=Algoriphagus halophytocola TaxID=2991499 RepID=A0ABY6MHC7_9BACT|nr:MULTISPECIES: DUF502 domain-containing protein [unclassified Algoriphagus]UZD22379.1 DUF502 domain-containing protein [Algoriphagus sp. TR-M5]WBL43638.1 DUF502 domain-containing protein [Algoriphagus sp. TR-M9]
MPSEANLAPTPQAKKQRGFFLDTLIQGFLILLPLTIILILLSVVFNFIFKIVSPLSTLLDGGADSPHWLINVLSFGIFCAFIFLIGVVVRNRVGKVYFKTFERKYLSRIPLYSLIHQTVYQFIGVKKLPFSEVVLIDPFKTGTMMTGFVTDQIQDRYVTVFVPTAPNPTNGNIYHVRKDDVIPLSSTTQDAMRTIMGMGAGTSDILVNTNLDELCTKYDLEKKYGVDGDPGAELIDENKEKESNDSLLSTQ